MFSGMVEGSFIRSVVVVLHFKGKWRREGGCSRQGAAWAKARWPNGAELGERIWDVGCIQPGGGDMGGET